MTHERLTHEAVLRIGEVSSVAGRRVLVSVDREKNLSELFYLGDVLKNVSVGSYVDIRKGFISLIGKVEGENAQPDDNVEQLGPTQFGSRRLLTVGLVGYLDRSKKFCGGTKELPLVGNEVFLLAKELVQVIHSLARDGDLGMNIATSDYEGYPVSLPVDGLMNSHVAIFGNTGSGKSNTLASLYQCFVAELQQKNKEQFEAKCRILLLDFNGEYGSEDCITNDKKVYRLSTQNAGGDKLPLSLDGLLDIETISILSDATEKTQKPFLRRVLKQHRKIRAADNSLDYLRNIVRRQVRDILQMSDKIRADLLVDYLRQFLPPPVDEGVELSLDHDIEWHNQSAEYKIRISSRFLRQNPAKIEETAIFRAVDELEFPADAISEFMVVAYIQLIWDVLSNRAQNEHIAPVIGKLKSKKDDIEKVFDTKGGNQLFSSNVVIISLNDVNIDMRKTIPLLLCKRVYQEHRRSGQSGTLNIVIDEAHNILSQASFREAESWKDYRLETFEEIIKEGRKFGVFVTIASQRPNDISPTITSQAHNYFIHRLINQKDLQSISNAVSYIDKITEESIPTLPVGTCIFSGVATQMPLKLAINLLPLSQQPKSETQRFKKLLSGNESV